MTKFGKQLLKQYSKLGNEELEVQFKGRNIPTPKNASYVNARNIALQNLKNQYEYYLRRYEEAYGQLMVRKSQVLSRGFIDDDGEEISTLESTVTRLNKKLMDIVSQIKNNNIQNDKEISDLINNIQDKNQAISSQQSQLGGQKDVIDSRFQELNSEAQMMIYGQETNRHKRHMIHMYWAFNIIAIIFLIGLYTKLKNQK